MTEPRHIAQRRFLEDPIYTHKPIVQVFRVRVFDGQDQELYTFTISDHNHDDAERIAKERYPSLSVKLEEIE